MESAKPDNEKETLIVGLGASAGGLDPLKLFFHSLPDHTGMAFIVVVHLSPEHESNMAELLQMQTSLDVMQITERTEIKPDHVYVIPPDKLLSVGDNHLELSDPDRDQHGLATVDLFFRTLGKTKGKYAACIILSGSGADGSVGLKTIKENGGLTIVQDPEEARYNGMPKNAINTGVVDMVLPVKKMAERLLEYSRNMSEIKLVDAGAQEDDQEEPEEAKLQQIFKKLPDETGHDFSNYKRSSVLRRIERRMQVNGQQTLSAYTNYIDENPEEIEELFKDLLISVTSFFRDPEAFKALKEKVIPELFKEKGADEELRIWVPGCATGEEAYSIAILLHEHARQLNKVPEIQIFATDIDDNALNLGRRGVYPESIAADLTKERLRRYFKKVGHEYHLEREITDQVLFAPHNLLRDPPFSKIDLISCRNLLIYLNRDFQSEVFKLFQYALRPGGWLFLGASDSNLEATELFISVDTEHRIYQKSTVSQSKTSLPKLPLQFNPDTLADFKGRKKTAQPKTDLESLHQKMLLRLYAPQSVIINDKYEVIHSTDGIKQFLQFSGGEPSLNILDMVVPKLRQPLRSLLFQADKNDSFTGRKQALMGPEGDHRKIELIVHRLSGTEYPKGLMHVVFKEATQPGKTYADDGSEVMGKESETIYALEKELEETREQLQVTIEEYETSNEELRSSNEELQSMNEELQSTTEELETSQEELQSVNEELKTVNQELEEKVEQLSEANSDLKNLMEATEVGILFVDRELCVQRFTSSTTDIFNLISSDKGRPLADVTHRLKYDSLNEDLAYVLDTLEKIKKIVASKDGHWYVMRIRPYRSLDDKIQGVVLTFMEITQLREAQEQLQQQRRQESLATLGIYALEEDDLSQILHRAMQQLCLGLEVDYAVLLKWDHQENMLHMAEHTGWNLDEDEITEFPADQKWDVGFTLRSDGPVVVSSYKKEDRFNILPLLERFNITSGVTAKVIESDKIWGVFGLYSKQSRRFSEDDLNFIQIISNLMGISSERAKTKKALQESNQQLQKEIERSRKFQKEILQNSIKERWNLGGYLHDNLAQTLASIRVLISNMGDQLKEADIDVSSDINLILENIDEGIEGVRNLTHEIIPVDIEKEGVRHAFKLLVKQLKEMHEVNCKLEIEEIVDKIRDQEVATNLYHIIQEAVKNSHVHGAAKNVTIELREEGENLKLLITDDGKGISGKEREDGGSGLNIMQHRIELLGGSFGVEQLSDQQKTGTRIICTLPVKYLSGIKREKQIGDES